MKQLFTIVFLLISAPVLHAQDIPDLEPHIYEAWTGFTIKGELNKKFTIALENQIRLSENYDGVRLNFIDLGLKYSIYKGLAFKAKYRYSFRNQARNTKRISFDLSYKLKIKPAKLALKYRVRYQNTQVAYTDENVDFLRNKLTLSYKLHKKWEGYAAYEIFHNMNDENEHQANRFILGVTYELKKQLKLKSFVQYDQDIHGKYKPTRTVFGLMGTYAFK